MHGHGPSDRAAAPVVFWRWRIAGAPSLLQAAPLAEATRAALGRCALRLLGTRRLPECLHGHSPPLPSHPHAFYLPEDADGDGYIDHLLLSASGGLDSRALTLCGALREVELDGHRFELETVRVGHATEQRGGAFGPARVWVSRTPYLTPLHALKKGQPRDRYGLSAQVARELTNRGLPGPERIVGFPSLHTAGGAWFPPDFVPPSGGTRRQTGGRIACFLRLEFAQPLRGPLALGHACHFGLGHFVPVR